MLLRAFLPTPFFFFFGLFGGDEIGAGSKATRCGGEDSEATFSLEVRGAALVHLKLVQTRMHWIPRCRPVSTGSFDEELHPEL